MDTKILSQLEKLSLKKAQQLAVSLIDRKKTSKIKVVRLERDIAQAPNSTEVSRIMWNVLLGGEGLSTTDSQWNNFYRNV